MISLFTHGSPNKIDKFELFNGKINRFNNTVVAFDNDVVFSNNNNDAYGTGVYAYYGVNTDEASTHAAHEDNPGYVYVLKVEHTGFINDLKVNYLDVDEWVDIANNMIETIQKLNGFDQEKINEAISELVSEWDSNDEVPENSDTLKALHEMLPDIESDVPIEDYDDPYEWENDIQTYISEIGDPCVLIYEEIYSQGSMENFINDTINRSENFWQVIRKMSDTLSVLGNNGTSDFYSKAFNAEVSKYEKHPGDLSVARAHPDLNFGVIFNTDAIEIRNVIDLSKVKEKESTRESSLDI